ESYYAARKQRAMPADPHRALVQKKELAIAIEALMREEAVVNYYAARGKKVISLDDNQTRSVLHMSAAEPAADILVELGPNQLIIAEVKGSNLDRALTQLQNTARKAAVRYQSIACKIYVRNQAPRGYAVDLRGGGYGFRAVRVFHGSFPGEWLLYEYDGSGGTKLIRIGSDPVCIIFGPHV
ncbi:MAG: hypothetical protein ACRD7E_13175, partial [Bryobacteraceae bacterium]